jgi:Putative MetA-pathway of phenol degradation
MANHVWWLLFNVNLPYPMRIKIGPVHERLKRLVKSLDQMNNEWMEAQNADVDSMIGSRWSRMKQAAALISSCIALAVMLGIAGRAQAQQLEPRAYVPAPVGANLFGLGYLYSYGGADLDPSSPVQNVYARVNSGLSYYSRTFGLLGRQASVTVSTAYAWYTVHGDVFETAQSIRRSGFFDPAMRFAVNLMGGPALKPLEFFRRKPETTLGTSLTIIAPFGQYDPSKLINLGTNRWSFKPELGLSQPVGDWAFEVYAGVWLFTDNDNYFGGHVRRQDPMESYQGHVVYNFSPHMWASVDYTYYVGGSTTIDGQRQNDRQENTRTGLTLAVPVTSYQTLKFAWSRGVTTRIGTSFDTLGVVWQLLWF